MNSWRIWLGLAVIFLSGLLTGVLGVGFYLRHTLRSFQEQGPSALDGVVVKGLDWKLDLSDQQRVQVTAAVEDTHREFMRFRAEHHDQLMAIMTAALDRLEGLIEPEQQPAWRRIREAVEAHLTRFGRPP